MEPLPSGPYGVVYCDPAWSFVTYSENGKGRSAEQHYECMTLKQIADMPVADIAAKDSVLLMWTTDPMLEKGLGIIKSWGFSYKTVGFYWAKTNRDGGFFVGMGYWSRANVEMCLLATRGNPKRNRKDVRKLIVSPRREHSRKPDEMYDSIEALCYGPYLELWSRTKRDGWDSWGNEVAKFQQGRALPKVPEYDLFSQPVIQTKGDLL